MHHNERESLYILIYIQNNYNILKNWIKFYCILKMIFLISIQWIELVNLPEITKNLFYLFLKLYNKIHIKYLTYEGQRVTPPRTIYQDIYRIFDSLKPKSPWMTITWRPTRDVSNRWDTCMKFLKFSKYTKQQIP